MPPWLTPEGIAVKPVYGPDDLDGPRFPRHLSGHRALSARPLPHHVRHPAVDDPAICRLLDRRGFQRLLPPQPRGRPEGPLGRLRSRHPSRLRQRPSARRRRRRHGGRGDRLDLRHAHAVLRHPARPDDRVDDHERRGAAGAGALHRRRRGAGRAARRSSPAPSRTTSSKSSWCATPTSIRPAPSLRIISDIFAFTAAHMPKFNSISISGYHMQEAGATAGPRARLHARRRRRIRARRDRRPGSTIDRFAPRLSFFWAIGMNFFMEVAKLRAARLLWAKLMKPFDPKDARSLSLRTHCQTSGWSLTAQDVFNNVRAHLRSRRWRRRRATRSRCTPTRSTRRSRCRPTFPPASRATRRSCCSRRVRHHPHRRSLGRLVLRRAAHLRAGDARPGPISRRSRSSAAWPRRSRPACPKLRIEEAAAKTQARIDAGQQSVIGVNKYRPEHEAPIDVLKVDNAAVRQLQIDKLARLEARARSAGGRETLAALTRAADRRQRQPAGARHRCRARQGDRRRDLVALEKVFGRHRGGDQGRSPASTSGRSA